MSKIRSLKDFHLNYLLGEQKNVSSCAAWGETSLISTEWNLKKDLLKGLTSTINSMVERDDDDDDGDDCRQKLTRSNLQIDSQHFCHSAKFRPFQQQQFCSSSMTCQFYFNFLLKVTFQLWSRRVRETALPVILVLLADFRRLTEARVKTNETRAFEVSFSKKKKSRRRLSRRPSQIILVRTCGSQSRFFLPTFALISWMD